MGDPDASSVSAASRLDELFALYERRVFAYARRRALTEADAQDAAVETFTVAWRKIDQVPTDALPWLLGVARRVLANQRRSSQRRAWLVARLRRQPMTPPHHVFAGEPQGGPALAAVARLPARDQELLRLLAWDELDHAGIAGVLGISVNAVAIRLHRARKRFRDELLKDAGASRTPTRAKGTSPGAIRERIE